MGFFTKKKTVVASQTIDLQGTDKPNYFKLAVLNGSFKQYKTGEPLVGSLLDSMFSGSYSMQRKAFIWATKHYQDGFPTINIPIDLGKDSIFKQIAIDYLTSLGYKDFTLNNTFQDSEDIGSLVQAWLIKNYNQKTYNYTIDPTTDDDNFVYAGIKRKIPLIPPVIPSSGKEIEYTDEEYKEDNPDDPLLLNKPDVLVKLSIFDDLHYDPDKIQITFNFTDSDGDSETEYYIIGSGYAALDDFSYNKEDHSQDRTFFPIIPIRMDKNWINDGNSNNNKTKVEEKDPSGHTKYVTKKVNIPSYNANLFKTINKYFIKLQGNTKKNNLNALQASIQANNDNIGQINFSFIHMSININTNTKWGAGYIYHFFQEMKKIGVNRELRFQTKVYSGNFIWTYKWTNVQESTEQLSSLPQVAQDHILKKNNTYTTNLILSRKLNYAYQLSSGLKVYKLLDDKKTLSVFTIFGLQSSTYVIKGKWVTHSWFDLINDWNNADQTSALILIPYHKEVIKRLSIRYRNELTTENEFLVLSSFKTKKVLRGIFKVIIAIAGIVIGALVGGFFLGASALSGGFLGSAASAAVGGGVMGILAGMIANSTVLVLLSTILEPAFNKLGIFGQIVKILFDTLLLSFLQISSFTGAINFFSPSGLSSAFIHMFDPKNLMNLATRILQGFENIQQQQTLKYMSSAQRRLEQQKNNYDSKLNEIQRKKDELGLSSNSKFNYNFTTNLKPVEYPQTALDNRCPLIQDMINANLETFNQPIDLTPPLIIGEA